MATLAASQLGARKGLPKGEILHRIVMWAAINSFMALIAFLILNGASYYMLSPEERPYSPLHASLRSSGTVGLKLGILGLAMFGVLFLYPLRKRWKWLARIGATRRWLNLHVLFGITTPLVITFHTAFKWHGLAGLAYWTMIAVALSGFVGRYVYAKIPRSINSVQLEVGELEAQVEALGSRLREQNLFSFDDLAPLLNVPSAKEIRNMNGLRALVIMLRIDLARPFLVTKLRRRTLHGSHRITTLGGWLGSHNQDVEAIVATIRRQARLRTAIGFLDRTQRIFHLWHVVHRPFSISFVVLILIHIVVVLSVGLR
jgi:hypothetical protein